WPLPGPGVPDVDPHVEDTADAFEEVDGGARTNVLGEHAVGHHVDDLELGRLPGLGLFSRARARPSNGRPHPRPWLAQDLLERAHLGARALRASVEHPYL